MQRATLLLISLSLAVGAAAAGEPIIIGETVTIQSRILGEERTVLISTPSEYGRGQERYPVLYMTDGNTHFTHTRGTVDFLAQNGLMPQLIVVAVANTDRNRDLTPTNATITEDDGRVREFPTSGGASKFLDFFSQELFPYIDANYRTLPFRAFSGHSFGGLFALNAAFSRPDMFDAVIAVGPSLHWDDELPLRQAAAFVKASKKFPAPLFVAMANELEGEPRPNALDQLEATLQQASDDGFEWQVMRMPDETHGSLVLRAHYWGLRELFEPWLLPRDPETRSFAGTLADLKAHYAGLSRRLGFEVIPGENIVNQVGYQILGTGDVDNAIAVFQYNVELYPGSANVYDSLGEGLENAGSLEEALANYTRAVDNASNLGDDRLPIFTANRDRIRQQLEQAQKG
jgi:predicted alpha/beta superfamily hydrolase